MIKIKNIRLMFGTPDFGWIMYGIAWFGKNNTWFFGFSTARSKERGF